MKKPKKLGRLALVAALAVALATPFVLAGCGGSDDPEPSGDAPAEQSEVEEPASDYVVTIDGSTVTTDYEDNPAIIIDYSFTNNSEEAISFAVACHAKVFQNGVQLESAIVAEDLGNGYMAEIKPGATTTARLAYVLTDESDVTVEVEELFSLDDTLLAEATYSVA